MELKMDVLEKAETVKSSNSIGVDNPSKLLSICMFGRDDDYMLDFLYRITTTINHLSRSIKNLGLAKQIEILVTDWGSQVPMAQTLELSSEAAEVCTFIYVPREVILATQEDKDYFHTSRAPNVAIRRACGKYIMLYTADTLILEHSLEQMVRMLKGDINLPIDVKGTFIYIPRLNVPWQFLERRPGIEEWDRYLHLVSKNEPLEPKGFFFLGHAGALMMHHTLWQKYRGFDERMSRWGFNDIDLGFRVTHNHPFFSLSGIGVFLYHMAHKSDGRRRVAISQGNPNRFNDRDIVNDENWGFGNFELTIQAPQKVSSAVGVDSKSLEHTQIPMKSVLTPVGEIVSELTNAQLERNVKRIIISCLSRGWVLKRSELNAFFFLAWYSGKHFPRRYLDVNSNSIGVGTVVKACPTVEFYKIGHWKGIQPDDSPLIIRHLLDTFRYRGYVRFVNGDIKSSLQRLKNSFIGDFVFDLMFVGGKMVDEVTEDQVCDLISYLSPGGALILSYPSANDFMCVWQKIKDNYNHYTYFHCADHKTGMVLAAKFRDYNFDECSQISDISFDTKWLTITRIKAIFFGILLKWYPHALALFGV
jgi:hypothetical protein